MGQEEVDAANRLILDLISKYRVIIARMQRLYRLRTAEREV